MLFPEEEKIIVEETKSNGQTVIEERLALRFMHPILFIYYFCY